MSFSFKYAFLRGFVYSLSSFLILFSFFLFLYHSYYLPYLDVSKRPSPQTFLSPHPSLTAQLVLNHQQITPLPEATSVPVPTLPQNNLLSDTSPWGVATQIGEYTWTMKVSPDPVMAYPSEILSALNVYRKTKSSQPLSVDTKLQDYAQSRADYLYSIKGTDQHQGFNDFLENQDGFNKLSFTWVGENLSYGYQLNGVHLIEWVYAGDEPHDKNQSDPKWSHVGIGVKGTATCLIFATGKM